MPSGSSRSGSCLGCLGVLVAILCAVLSACYWVFWYSAVPLILLAGLINQSEKVKIDGVTGSFAHGIQLKRLEIRHDDGRVSYLDDVGYSHNSFAEMAKNRRIVLQDAHAKSAHLYLYTTSSSDRSDSSKKQKSTKSKKSNKTSASDSWSGIELVIDRINITDVTIEETRTGQKFELRTFAVNNFRTNGNDVSLEKLEMVSNKGFFRAWKVGKRFEMAGSLLTGVGGLKRDVTFSGQGNFENPSAAVATFQAFDKALTIEVHPYDLRWSVEARRISLKSYFDWNEKFDDFECLVVATRSDESTFELALRRGSFTICDHPFTVAPKTVEVDTEKPVHLVLTAQGTASGHTINVDAAVDLPEDGPVPDPWYTLTYRATPATPPADVQGLLCPGQ